MEKHEYQDQRNTEGGFPLAGPEDRIIINMSTRLLRKNMVREAKERAEEAIKQGESREALIDGFLLNVLVQRGVVHGLQKIEDSAVMSSYVLFLLELAQSLSTDKRISRLCLRTRSKMLNDLAIEYIRSSEHKNAIDCLEEAIRLLPTTRSIEWS